MEQLTQEQTMDVMLNHNFFNHEAAPSILGLQVPNFVTANSTLMNNAQSNGLEARYNVLLGIIEELKKDVRPTYAGSKTSGERLKRNINLARIEIRNCMQELESELTNIMMYIIADGNSMSERIFVQIMNRTRIY